MTLPDGSQPFIFNEVIDLGGEPISGSEYFSLGRITEFKYCNHMFGAFRKYFPLNNLWNFGEAWGMYPSQNALVFVDNHDNQRGHGAGE
jgi:alpha-amylase